MQRQEVYELATASIFSTSQWLNIGDVSVIDLPYIPPQIPFARLNKSLLIMDPTIVSVIQENLEDNGRFTKEKIKKILEENGIEKEVFDQVNRTIVRINGELFGVYVGNCILGKGSYGKVKFAQQLTGNQVGKFFAIKIQTMPELEESKSVLLSEFDFLSLFGKTMQPEMIVRESKRETLRWYNQCIQTAQGRRRKNFAEFFKKNAVKKCDILMELAPGKELFELLKNQLPILVRLQIAINIVKACVTLHESGYLHGDIKLENIMVDPLDLSVQLIDLAFMMKKKNGVCTSFTRGTPEYMSFEVRENAQKGQPTPATYSDATDAYAVAICLAELFNVFESPDLKNFSNWDRSYIFENPVENPYEEAIRLISHEIIDNGLSLKDAQTNIEACRDKYLREYNRRANRSAYIIDLKELNSSARTVADQNYCIASIAKNFVMGDMVILTNTDSQSIPDQKLYLDLKNRIERPGRYTSSNNQVYNRRGITVADKVFIGGEEEVRSAINKYLENHPLKFNLRPVSVEQLLQHREQVRVSLAQKTYNPKSGNIL